MRALPVHRQILAMALAAIGTHIEVALDIRRHLAPQVAFDFVALFEDLSNLGDLVIGQIIGLAIERNTGDSTPIGCTAAQMSCTKPGNVSSAERQPPPGASDASSTSTFTPARASNTAAVSPFGPLPTTIAS